MNKQEAESKINVLRSELKQSKKISEVIAKFKEIKGLIDEFNQTVANLSSTRESSIRNLLREEHQNIQKLVYSVINPDNYVVNVNLRDTGADFANFEYWNSYRRIFHLIPKNTASNIPALPERTEHDWKINGQKDEEDEMEMEDMYDEWDIPWFSGDYKRLRRFYRKEQERMNLCDRDNLDKISLTRQETSSASFSSERIMMDAKPLQKVFGQILTIMNETDVKIKEINENYYNSGCDCRNYPFYHTTDNVLYELVHSFSFTQGINEFRCHSPKMVSPN